MVRNEQDKVYLKALGFASLAVVVLFIIFIDVPDAIVYARKGAFRWLPFLLIFGALPFSAYKTLELFYPKHSVMIAVGFLLIIGPLFGIQINRFDQLALERDGQVVQGTIIQKKQFKPSNRAAQWLVKAKFEVQGQAFETFSLEDKKNELEQGQEIEVIYSKRNPNINTFHFMFKEETE